MKYILTSKTLCFDLSTTELKCHNTLETLCFDLSTTELKCHNTLETLFSKLREYSENVPIFKIVLDFIDIFGGIY